MDGNFLRSVLAGESRAYGFTIAFWGSGILLVKMTGSLPAIENILLYGLGAVLGFGLLAVLAFRQALDTVEYDRPEYLVLSMVHYLAALAPIIVTYLILESRLPRPFLLSGFNVAVVYNLLMMVEKLISEEARLLEKKLVGF